MWPHFFLSFASMSTWKRRRKTVDICKGFMKYELWLSKCFWKYLNHPNRADVFAKFSTIQSLPSAAWFCPVSSPRAGCRWQWIWRKFPKSSSPSYSLEQALFSPFFPYPIFSLPAKRRLWCSKSIESQEQGVKPEEGTKFSPRHSSAKPKISQVQGLFLPMS